MFSNTRTRRLFAASACFAVTALAASGQTPQPAPTPSPTPKPAITTPKAQVTPDAKAYAEARAVKEPAAKVEALRKFVKDFPESTRVAAAQSAIFSTLVDSLPEREGEIKAQAKYLVDHAEGEAKYNVENTVASQLAEAEPHGLDLKDAEKYARDMVKHNNEKDFTKLSLEQYAKYKMPTPPAAEVHERYAEEHANLLQTMGEVYYAEGKIPETRAVLAEAYALDPQDSGVLWLRAEMEAHEHDEAAALKDFEMASVYGALKPRLKKQMMELYKSAHGGSDAGFEAEIDARYAQAFPEKTLPMSHQPVAGGHTVLMELFTGSGCNPCVAMDLAMEDVLQAYPRSEVIALAWDMHIPRPDPLANPDSVARGKLYGIRFTPTYLIDGHDYEPNGGNRKAADKFYKMLSRNLDTQAARPSSVQLAVTATPGANGTVQAHATVSLGDLPELKKQIAAVPADVPDPDAKPVVAAKALTPAVPAKPAAPAPAEAAAKAEAPKEPKFVVNFALVEDDVRYAGENGLRLHRMVVRSLAKPAEAGFDVTPGGSATLDAAFDTAEVSRKLSEYLDAYAKKNDRFDHVEWLSKDTSLNMAHLGVAVWVQDATTHRVLQTAYAPLAAATAEVR